MRRTISIWTLTAALFTSFLITVPPTVQTVEAKEDYSYYPMQNGCSAFEVDRVVGNNGQVSFEYVDCTTDWNQAKSEMYALGWAGVIRHSSSYSPSKIINMTAGVVYTYPQRDGKNTLTVDEYYDIYSSTQPETNKTMAITWHREMQYYYLATRNNDGTGKVYVNASGFEGFVELKDVDLIPMVVIQNGWGMYLGGNSTYDDEEPFMTYPRQQYYRVERNGNYTDLVLHYFSGWGNVNNGGQVQEWTSAVGPAADWMSVGSVYFSYDNVTFYTDRTCTQQAGVYYPYYEFAFLRSKTGISVSTFNKFLADQGKDSSSKLWDTGEIWLAAQDEYGINAMEIFALACLESAYGTSRYAQELNNLFGWNAVDSDPDQASYFSSVTQSIQEMMGINLRGYLNTGDWRYFGSHLGNKGSGLNVKYATDNYWGIKIAAIAYALDKCDNDYDGTLTDFNSQSMGIVKNDAYTNILKAPDGDVLYPTQYGQVYQKNHTLSIISSAGDWYQVRSTDYLDSSGSAITSYSGIGYLTYNWDTMTGWIRKDEVTLINGTPIQTTGEEAEGDPVQTLAALSWNEDGSLHLAGQDYVPGIYVTETNPLSETLSVQDFTFTDVLTADLTVTVSGQYVAQWSTDLDVSALAEGDYFFCVENTYGKTTDYNGSYILPSSLTLPQEQVLAGKTYSFSSFDWQGTSVVLLTVASIDCGTGAAYDEEQGACVCVSGYENWVSGSGCSVITNEESYPLVRSLDTAAWNEEDKTLTLNGIAYLSGLDAAAEGSETVTIRLRDMSLEEEDENAFIDVEAEVSALAEPFTRQGHTYQYVQYDAVIPYEDLKEGTYEVMIRVTHGDVSKTGSLYSISDAVSAMTPQLRSDGAQVRFYASAKYNYRLEMRVQSGAINEYIAKTAKAISMSASTFGADTLKMEEGKLILAGYAYMQGSSVAEADGLNYQMLAVNEAGDVTAFTLANTACTFDLTGLAHSASSLEDACFDAEIDLTRLSEGTYVLYLDLSAGAYRDVFEMYNIRDMEPLEMTWQGRTYSLAKTSIHDRFELVIQEVQ